MHVPCVIVSQPKLPPPTPYAHRPHTSVPQGEEASCLAKMVLVITDGEEVGPAEGPRPSDVLLKSSCRHWFMTAQQLRTSLFGAPVWSGLNLYCVEGQRLPPPTGKVQAVGFVTGFGHTFGHDPPQTCPQAETVVRRVKKRGRERVRQIYSLPTPFSWQFVDESCSESYRV